MTMSLLEAEVRLRLLRSWFCCRSFGVPAAVDEWWLFLSARNSRGNR